MPNDSSPGRAGATRTQPAPRIPDHELLRLIGGGSYGEVWLARSVMGTYRAVKIVYRRTFDTARPFEREFGGIQKFEPVSRLHDGLMDILQVGRNDEAGYFYYVMELADAAGSQGAGNPNSAISKSVSETTPVAGSLNAGLLITDYDPRTLASELERRGRLPFEECLSLFLSLTSALGHLHQHGLIHRDIKPSNIIFVNGVAKLADIGLVSEAGQSSSYVGTEGYIPPEGAGTRQADLYSLGKVFYELSTGKDRTEFPSLPIDAVPPAETRRLLELNAIFIKACENDVRHRYQSVEEMHADLALLQSGKSVKRLRVIERRLAQATRLSTVAAVLLALVLAAYALSERQRRTGRESLKRAERAEQRAREKEQDATDRLWNAYRSQAQATRRTGQPGQRVESLAAIAKAAAIRPAPELRDEAIACLAMVDVRRVPVAAASGWIGGLTPDLERYVEWGKDDGVRIRRLTDGKELARLPHRVSAPRCSFSFSRDGRLLLLCEAERELFAWDLPRGALFHQERADASVLAHEFSPDNRMLAVGYANGAQVFRELDGGRTNRVLHARTGWIDFQFSPDGRHMAVRGPRSNAVDIVEIQTGQVVQTLPHPRPIFGRAWSPDGGRLATACEDANVYIWDTVTGSRLQVLGGHRESVGSVVFLGSDDLLASASSDGTLRLWDVPGARPWLHLLTTALLLQFNPDNGRLGWRTHDAARAALYEVVTNTVTRTLAEPKSAARGGPFCVEFSPDERWLVSGTHDGLRVFDSTSGRELAHWHGRATRSVAFSPADGSLITCSSDQLLRWPVTTVSNEVILGPPLVLVQEPSLVSAGLGDRGDLLACTQAGRPARVLRGSHTVTLADSRNTDTIAVSPDGRWVAAHIADDSGAWLWEARTGRRVRELRGLFATHVAFSPDSQRLITGSVEEYCFWNVTNGMPGLRLPRAEGIGSGGPLAFGDNGRLLAIARTLSLVQLIDVTSGRELASLEHPDPQTISWLAFSPSGTRLAVATQGHVIQLWDLRKLRQELAALKLDWDQAPFPSTDLSQSSSPLRVKLLPSQILPSR